MALNNDYDVAGHALPTPTEIPQRTSSKRLSREPAHSPSSSPGFSSSPPQPFKEDDRQVNGLQGSKHTSNDESLSILDPRRFTPTLHASLIAEILSLRREIESQNSLVGSLEQSLHSARIEHESLNDSLRSSAKESRSIKRQMHLLEGGTLSALGDLARERDEAFETLADTRRRLEASQKKLRGQEEDADRIQAVWERDRQLWDTERRKLDTKVHIVEGRLKAVLAEVAAGQPNGQYNMGAGNEAEGRYTYKHVRRGSDTVSNRSNSAEGRRWRNGLRKGLSRSPTPNGFSSYGSARLDGISLAEELEADDEAKNRAEESEDDDDNASPRDIFVESQLRSRSFSAMSFRHDRKARKVLGLSTDEPENLIENHAMLPREEHHGPGQDTIVSEQTPAASLYTDTATQFSPPPSPKLQATPPREKPSNEQLPVAVEHAANQRRKRVSMQTPLSKPPSMSALAVAPPETKTAEEPVSPLWTPAALETHLAPSATLVAPVVGMKSVSTQTSADEILSSSSLDAPTRDGTAFLTIVPTIAIHPPGSRPHSRPTSTVLPPHTRNVACQASIRLPVNSRSMQTEGIRVDKRPYKLTRSLLPSAVSARLSSPSSESERLGEPQRPQPPPDQSSLTSPPVRAPPPPPSPPLLPTLPSQQHLTTGAEGAYPGNNDNGPLAIGSLSKLRRPIRTGSLFAGFDAAGDERVVTFKKLDLSDDDSAFGEPIRKTLSKVQNSWKLVPQSEANPLLQQQDPAPRAVNRQDSDNNPTPTPQEQTAPSNIPRTSANNTIVQAVAKPGSLERPPMSGNLVKEPDVRRAALISSGVAAHSQGSRSPSVPSLAGTEPPPFPVPIRSSSRQRLGSSDGTGSPTPYAKGYLVSQRRQSERMSAKKLTLYTIQSVGVLPEEPPKHGRQESGPQSPRPTSFSTAAPDSPRLPPLPRNDITSHYQPASQGYKQHPQGSIKESDAATASAISTVDQPSVIDAIAQTMVGEWMWKYVRRRKSFGMSESPQADFDNGRNNADNMTGNGARHKRWVWLAPYECAVMWSSKQPTSGPALLGKGGRKLAIQSVLDVKDDSPLPKNAGPHAMFARSILILTPQRALKFTATSRDRHYVWLTALSFLSHSSLGAHDLPPPPPLPQQDSRPSSRQQQWGATSRRSSIRDSIRVAKAKARPAIGHAHSSPVGIFRSGNTIHEGDTFHFPQIPDDSEHEAAAAPHVPRFPSHTRQRSNTGPTPITSAGALRRLSNSNSNLTVPLVSCAPPESRRRIRSTSSANASEHSFFDRAALDQLGSGVPSGVAARRASATSEGVGGRASPNFSDAMGTVRMEAFVEGVGVEKEMGRREEEYEGRQRSFRGPGRAGGSLQERGSGTGSFQGRGSGSGSSPGRGSGSLQAGKPRRKDMSYWGNDVPAGSVEEAPLRVRGGGTGWGEVDDPFEGF
ncbi:Pleckstrin homology domain, Mcp5-type [Lasallia pustulata]|uniref:Pleckstrin homology domain, Mcp5-type n=1 Tax=Lasallia pustulata TaxID=136370 RepID=A0A1W5D692_9LECA|nr:Pleckstrin homology domain, Mcp5-type [Lasallia pustulata]